MKTLKIITAGLILLLVTSCATSSVSFPISSLVPAAEISASKKKNVNNNYDIKLTAKYLANPSRLNPSKKVYVAWIVTEKKE